MYRANKIKSLLSTSLKSFILLFYFSGYLKFKKKILSINVLQKKCLVGFVLLTISPKITISTAVLLIIHNYFKFKKYIH